jgi:hypothetical protein
MRGLLLSVVWLAGAFSVGCAHAQDSTPPPQGFGQEPPEPPRPPRPGKDGPERHDSERRGQIERLENDIRETEANLKREDMPEERRLGLKKRLEDMRAQLKELLARGGPNNSGQEKMSRLERQIHELERKLESRDMGPEDRRELSAQLDRARAQMEELRMRGAPQDPMLRRPGQVHVDPESHKMHMESQELDRAAMDLSVKLRRIPADNKDERAEIASKLKDTVTQLFDLREKIRAREVEMIKKRLDELTQMLEKRKANRDAIIEKRLKQLSGEADELDW